MFDIKEHTCDVVKIKIENHPNADSLSLVKVGDFQCVVRTQDWKDGDLAVYIPPDNIVPNTEQFKFLGDHRRIKARKLRGEWSVGLLITAPDNAKIGEDHMESLGIIHYDPPICGNFKTGGDNVEPPKGFHPTYDVLNFRKYSSRFDDEEEVICTEKIHGANARYVCIDDKIFCGSRKFWKKESEDNLWWKIFKQYTVLESWLRHNQELTVYGEIFGNVQSLKYGAKNGELFFAAFDIRDGYKWLDFDEAHIVGKPLPWVPLVYRGGFDKDKILSFAEGDSLYPNSQNIREGIVIKPVHERTDQHIGRVQLKIISNKYLSKS